MLHVHCAIGSAHATVTWTPLSVLQDWCIEVEVDPHVVELTMESDEMHSKLPFRSQTVLAKSVYAMYQKQANTTNMATGNDDTTKQQSSTVNTTNGFLEGSTGAATAPMGSTAPTQDSTGMHATSHPHVCNSHFM